VDATKAALLYPGCDGVGPFGTMLAAKMSIQFGVAGAVARGRIDGDTYSDLGDPEIGRLVAVTTLTADPALSAAYPERQPARVTLVIDDGGHLVAELDDVVAASPDMVWQRFHAAARAALGDEQAADLESLVHTLATAADASTLNTLQVQRTPH
jgi:2-methylcitrate dehydratase PrpD